VGERLGSVALQVGSHATSQIHDTIKSLHIDLIWRPQRRMLIQQCPYLGRERRVAGASAGSALPICAVCGTSGKSARKDDKEGQKVEGFMPSARPHVLLRDTLCVQMSVGAGQKGAASEAGAVISGC